MMTSIMNKEGSITQISEKEGETQGSIRITPESGHSNEPVELKTISPGRIINPTGLDVLFGRGKPYQVCFILYLLHDFSALAFDQIFLSF
jgi:hypothetical protein